MPTISVKLRTGAIHQVSAQDGASIMEAIRDAGIDDLLALCGGCCSCCTCHVYIEPQAGQTLPPMSVDEDDLLDSSEHRQPTSRLACQIPCTSNLDGLNVAIAPEE